MPTRIERSLAELEELGDDVPDEIKDDFEVFVEIDSELTDEFADLDFDPSSGEAPDEETMQALTELGERFEDSDLQAAPTASRRGSARTASWRTPADQRRNGPVTS